MAGKRIYMTIPKHDFDLIRRQAMLESSCPGYWCRDQVLIALYRILDFSRELQDYDAELINEERMEVIHGRSR